MTRVERRFLSQQIASRRNNKRRSVDAKGVHPGRNKSEDLNAGVHQQVTVVKFSKTAMMLVREMTSTTLTGNPGWTIDDVSPRTEGLQVIEDLPSTPTRRQSVNSFVNTAAGRHVNHGMSVPVLWSLNVP